MATAIWTRRGGQGFVPSRTDVRLQRGCIARLSVEAHHLRGQSLTQIGGALRSTPGGTEFYLAQNMSEESQEPPATPEPSEAAKPARKRPSVRKSAKSKSAPNEIEPLPTMEAPIISPDPEPASPPSPERAPEATGNADDFPSGDAPVDVIPFSVETAGGESTPGNPKKRRRRKKKNGQGQPQGQGQGGPPPQYSQHPHAVAPPVDAPPQNAPEGPSHTPAPVMHAAPRPKLDPELVAKKAWKIFQAEVGEEGLALIDDHDAREISRRCFRLAEIFLDEAARRNR